MKNALIVIFLCSYAFGQVQAHRKATPKPDAKDQLIEMLKADLDRERAHSADLEKQLAAASKKYNDSIAILDTLASQFKGQELTQSQKEKLASVSPGDALNLGVEVEQQHSQLFSFALKLKEHDEMAVDKYNSLLSDYKDYVNRVGIQLQQINRSQRISNALAVYQMLPHYSPPQTINLNVTDCSKFPAMCIH